MLHAVRTCTRSDAHVHDAQLPPAACSWRLHGRLKAATQRSGAKRSMLCKEQQAPRIMASLAERTDACASVRTALQCTGADSVCAQLLGAVASRATVPVCGTPDVTESQGLPAETCPFS